MFDSGRVAQLLYHLFPQCEVVTVDSDATRQPTHVVDPSSWFSTETGWGYRQYERNTFDMIWVHDPRLNDQKEVNRKQLMAADTLSQQLMVMMDELAPKYWFLSSWAGPAPISLYDRPLMAEFRKYHSNYALCRYEARVGVSMHLWSNVPGAE